MYFKGLPARQLGGLSSASFLRIRLKKLIMIFNYIFKTTASGYLYQMSTGHLITPWRDSVSIMEEVDHEKVVVGYSF